MKRHTASLLAAALVLLTLFSCSPVEYPESLDRTAVEDAPVIYVTPHAKKADVAFTPVRNADSYTIELSGETRSIPLKLEDGLYTFTLRKLNPTEEYTLSITASNPAGAKTGEAVFTTTEDNGELEYAPIGYMSKRTETTAEITVNRISGITYRITLMDDGIPRTKTFSGNESVLVFDGLEKGKTYTVWVEHRKSTDPHFSTDVTKLTIPEYRAAFDHSINLSMYGTKAKIEDAKGKENLTLLFYPDGSGIPEVLETVKLADGLSFDISNLGVLRSGLFDAVLTDADGKNPVYSNPVYYTTPVMPVIEKERSNQTGTVLYWTQPEDMEELIYSVSCKSSDGRYSAAGEVLVSGNVAELKLDNLVSNTEYVLEIETLLPYGETVMSSMTFTTASFSGVYRWECPTPGAKVPSFVINVWDRKDAEAKGWADNWNDDYPYHIFVHPSDPAYTEDMAEIAIMPLFRPDDDYGKDFIPYAESDTTYKKGYRWNESKWNATGKIHPSSWYPHTGSVDGDHITSYTYSKTFVGQLTTKTDFTFRVKDGKAQLVFRNAGEGNGSGTVNMGLFKNPEPEPGTDKFTYVLTRIGSIE